MGKSLKGKELGEGIYQQPNGTYCARFVDKFGRRRSKRSKKLQEVRQWIADITYEDEHSDINKPANMTVNAWFEYWLGIKKQTLKAGSILHYEERYRISVKDIIGNKVLSEVKPIHCQLVFTNMANQGYSSTTITTTKAIVHDIFEHALNNDLIKSNPCRKKTVNTKIGKPPNERRALTIQEQKEFLELIRGHRYENHLKFVLQTGIRVGELTGLRWSDIDMDKRIIKINRTLQHSHIAPHWICNSPKTKAGIRTIPLTDEAVRILKEQRIKNNRIKVIPLEWRDLVFLHPQEGIPIITYRYDGTLTTLCKDTNLPKISMHILRHTFATRCIEGGMNPKTLQKIMGHSNIGITMNLYVHVTEDEKYKEINLVSKALNVI